MKPQPLYPAVIITGNPMEGFEYIGPFLNRQAAMLYIATDVDLRRGNDWIAPLHAPAEIEATP